MSQESSPRLQVNGRSKAHTAALALLLSFAGCSERSEPERLPGLAIDPGSVTVSGISSGGYMAAQFHVAYSDLVGGAGVLAAGPYYCAENSLRLALGRCMKDGEGIPTDRLLEITSHLALRGEIDPIAGLADDRVWIFHGADDEVVATPVVDALQAYYEALVRPENVLRVERSATGHTFPTVGKGRACGLTESPFLGNCGFDAARALLEQLYGPLQSAGGNDLFRDLREFDQRPYSEAAASRAFAEHGWLFVPEDCGPGARAHCRLHVVFHGCKQGVTEIGREFVESAGYLEVAAANSIVLLFPQVAPSYQPLNPNGCWDWWGYEGEDYALQRGAQMAVLRLMIADLLGEQR
jgi:poly(3-hydroxybutyrate) depolymerase